MSKTTTLRAPQPTGFSRFAKEEYRRLLDNGDRFPWSFGEVIYEPGDSNPSRLLPTSGIISLLAAVETAPRSSWHGGSGRHCGFARLHGV